MNCDEWAKNEINIAIKRELNGKDPKEWDYGAECYKSAYRAYESLMNDGHSGCSIGFTKCILNRLIDGKPLTPIEDIPEIWIEKGIGEYEKNNGIIASYQCARMSSLFKDVYSDGTVKYNDVSRVICCSDFDSSQYHYGYVTNLMNELEPISLPYSGDLKIKVICHQFKYNELLNSDWDTECISKAFIYKNGELIKSIDIHIYRATDSDDEEMHEIDSDEYNRRFLSVLNKKGE